MEHLVMADPGRAPVNGKVMLTFRIPADLVQFLRAEAARSGRDLTGQVLRSLDGLRTYCGLPEAATTLLEADRERLCMERYEYFLHALYQRSLQLREQGPGFDAPRSTRAEGPAPATRDAPPVST
jgi:uncharacterized protein (DUF1778 family)